MSLKGITRRGVQVVLGLLWLLDGALQLRHQMFTSNFANQVIAPAAQSQPVIVSGPMHLGIRIILVHPAFFDACFALIQLAIGAAILWKPTIKYGLIGSVVWGLFVWFGGEGLAGMASGHATLLMGAPGAALLYAIIALAVMPRKAKRKKQDTELGTQPDYWLAPVWAVLWIGGAIFQLMPGQDSVSALSPMIYGNSLGAPGWLSSLDVHVANIINGLGPKADTMAAMHMTVSQMAGMGMSTPQAQGPTDPGGYGFVLLLAILQICIGAGVFFGRYCRKTAIALGILLSLAFWIVGQSLGGYYTGLATDPNTAPLFILLGVAVLACTQLDQKIFEFWTKIDKSFG